MKATHQVTVTATIELSEAQMRAMDALVGYGIESFLKTFYTSLGSAYLKPHEHGMRELFKTIDADVRPALGKLDRARQHLKDDARRQQEKADAS